MTRSPFHEAEAALGAVFGDIEGHEVPLRFGRGGERERGAERERRADREDDWPGAALLEQARKGAGLVSLAACTRLKVTGADRIDLLQRLSTNDLRALSPGRTIPTIFANAKGRIVDRVHLFDRGETLLALGAPAGRRRIPAWIESFTFSEDVRVTDVTAEMAAFVLTGPAAAAIVREVAGVDPHSATVRPYAPAPEAAAGSRGFLELPIEGVATLVAAWDELPSAWIFVGETPGIAAVHVRALAAGRSHGLVPLGADDAEVLRVESGIPADGHELTEDWNPWEIRLESSFSLTKGCYTGQEVIARLATYDKIQRRLVGLRIDAPEAPPVPAKIYAREGGAGDDAVRRGGGAGPAEDDAGPAEGGAGSGAGKEIGTLTSAVASAGRVAGIAVLRTAWEQPGTAVTIGDARLPATVTTFPITGQGSI